MSTLSRRSRHGLRAAVYVCLVWIGTTVLAPRPDSVLLAVPIVCGAGLAYHAVTVGRVDALGRAALGVYLVLLVGALMVGGLGALGVIETPLPGRWVQLAATVGASVVLVVGYLVTATGGGNGGRSVPGR